MFYPNGLPILLLFWGGVGGELADGWCRLIGNYLVDIAGWTGQTTCQCRGLQPGKTAGCTTDVLGRAGPWGERALIKLFVSFLQEGSDPAVPAEVLRFPLARLGLKRQKRDWTIPPMGLSENAKPPFPKPLVQVWWSRLQ